MANDAEQDCCVEECCCHETDSSNEYQYRPVRGNSIKFAVKCHNDAHLCLSGSDQADDGQKLQLFIGGWHNAQSGLRMNTEDVARVDTPDIVSDEELRHFWLSWEDGHFRVGRGSDPEPFMTWHKPEPFPIRFVGFSTGWGSCGEWKFYDEALFETHSGPEYHIRAAHGRSVTFSVQSANDAHVALMAGPGVSMPMYQVFIGGWNNSKSAIRLTQEVVDDDYVGEDVCEADTPEILSADEMRSFTISWTDGDVKLFSTGESDPILQWKDPNPIQVTHYGYRTHWEADGKWRFEV